MGVFICHSSLKDFQTSRMAVRCCILVCMLTLVAAALVCGEDVVFQEDESVIDTIQNTECSDTCITLPPEQMCTLSACEKCCSDGEPLFTLDELMSGLKK